MKVLVACECSGVVRRAFRALGHDAWSCDLKPSEDNSPFHIQGDARDVVLWTQGGQWRNERPEWDMLIAHPVCRRLTNAGVRWLDTPPRGRTIEEMWDELREGAALFSAFWNAPIERVAVENPIMHKYARELIENFEQPHIVQPWWFGDETFKATGWTLRNLPRLTPTNKLTPPKKGTEEHKRWSWVHRMPPGPDREAARSRFHPGMSAAMAAQWGAAI